MTVIVTRNVPGRFRGFLASCMLEIAPGVYTAPRMNAAVRKRVWQVLTDWFPHAGEASIVLTWRDPSLVGGQGVKTLGCPARELACFDGLYLARRPLSERQEKELALGPDAAAAWRERFEGEGPSESGPWKAS